MHAGVMMAGYGTWFLLFHVVSSCSLSFVSWEKAVILHMLLAKAAKLMHGGSTGVWYWAAEGVSRMLLFQVLLHFCHSIIVLNDKGLQSHKAVDASQ